MTDRFETIKHIHANPRIIGFGFGYAHHTDRTVARVSAWDANGRGEWIVGEAPTLDEAWERFLRALDPAVLDTSPAIHQEPPAPSTPSLDFGALMTRG